MKISFWEEKKAGAVSLVFFTILYTTPEISHQYPEFPSALQFRWLCVVAADDRDSYDINDSDDDLSNNDTF